jgi:pimeloyl-ACP methyl ester carboxylesterase
MLRFMLRVMGSAPVRGLDVASNIVPRISARTFGVGRHLTSAGRKAFLGPYTDRTKRRTLHYQLQDSVRSANIFTSVEQALQGPLADKPVLTIFGTKNDPFGFQQRWKELFPHAIQCVVDGGHHFPMNDDPGLFARALRDFTSS